MNQRTPFGGLDKLTWEFITTNKVSDTHHATLKSKAEYMIRKDFSANELSVAVDFLAQVSGHVHTAIFDRLFRKLKAEVKRHWGVELPRRIVVKVPSYC